jgi:hypothetical protein
VNVSADGLKLDVDTDAGIARLLEMVKTVTSTRAKSRRKGQHHERDFDLATDEGFAFVLFLRQSAKQENNFSCGLRVEHRGESVILVRYNGSSHIHPNRLEGTKVTMRCHIHKRKEQYLKAGLSGDGFAEIASSYSTLGQAVVQLATDCNINGLPADVCEWPAEEASS